MRRENISSKQKQSESAPLPPARMSSKTKTDGGPDEDEERVEDPAQGGREMRGRGEGGRKEPG